MPLFAQSNRPVENAISFPNEYIRLDSVGSSRLFFTLFFYFDSIETIAKKRQKARVHVLNAPRTEVSSATKGLLSNNIETRAIALSTPQVIEKLYDQLCESIDVDLTSFVDSTSASSKTVNEKAYSKLEMTSSIKKVVVPHTTQLSSYVDTSKLLDSSKDVLLFNQGIFKASPSLNPSESVYKKKLEQSTTAVTSEEKITAAYVPSPITDVTSIIKAKSSFSVPTSSEDMIWIYVDLLDRDGQVSQTIQKNVSVSLLFGQTFTPEFPHVHLTRSSRSDDGKLVVAVDMKKGKDVILYHDNGNSTSALEVPSSGILTLTDTGKSSRVKAVYQDDTSKGYEFSSSAVMPRRASYFSTSGFLRALQSKSSVILQARNVPTDAASVGFYVINRSFGSKKPVSLSNAFAQVNSSSYTPTAIHSNPIPGVVYEYYYVSYMKDGTTRTSKPDIIEFFDPASEGYDTTVSDLVIDTPAKEVSFSLKTSLNIRKVDSLYDIFRSRGLESYISDYVEKGLNEIEKLFAYAIVRFDMTSGVRENLGLIVSGSFVDSRQAALTKAAPLRDNHTYSYEIYTTLTDPTTAFDSQKQEIKTFSGPVTIDNQKFRHVASLRNSTLLSPEGLKKKFSKSIFEFEVLGSPAVIEADFRQLQEGPLEVRVTRSFSSNKKVIVEWSPAADLADGRRVDHYVVSRTTAHGSRVLGRCAPISRPVFVDNLDVIGGIIYLVTPVYNDFSVGPASNAKIEVMP